MQREGCAEHWGWVLSITAANPPCVPHLPHGLTLEPTLVHPHCFAKHYIQFSSDKIPTLYGR